MVKFKVKEMVVLILVLIAIIFLSVMVGFRGVKNNKYNYVKLEINPKIEYVTDNKLNIVSVFPVNTEAKQLMCNENFVGLSAEEGTKKFIDLCVKANYIDVEREDNAVKLTVVTGLTERLDVKLYRTITKYFLNNEIKAVVLENETDLKQYKTAKNLGVSANKYSLMESVCNLYPDLTLNSAKQLTEKDMILKIKTAHQNLISKTTNYTNAEIEEKEKLIKDNGLKIENHNEKITKSSKQKFADEYRKFVKENLRDYKSDFVGKQKEWANNKINSYFA